VVLTVGVVSHNACQHLDACFDCISQLKDVDVHLAVADNASSDGSREFLSACKSINTLILNEKNVGFAQAHNQLISQTTGEYYMALNPDTRLTPNYAARVIHAISVEEDAGWGTGKILQLNLDGSHSNRVYSAGHALMRDGYAFNIGAGEDDMGQFDNRREVFGANGAAAVYKRQLLAHVADKHGEFFDSGMFLYFEDVDLDWRARLLGWHCHYVPDAVVYHLGNYTDANENPGLVAQGIANRYRSVLKNAFAVDLVVHNLPVYLLHVAARIVIHFPFGLQLLRPLRPRTLAGILRQRHRIAANRRINHKEMRSWFAWAASQPGADRARLRSRMAQLGSRKW
jgi:hypothetical protein